MLLNFWWVWNMMAGEKEVMQFSKYIGKHFSELHLFQQFNNKTAIPSEILSSH